VTAASGDTEGKGNASGVGVAEGEGLDTDAVFERFDCCRASTEISKRTSDEKSSTLTTIVNVETANLVTLDLIFKALAIFVRLPVGHWAT